MDKYIVSYIKEKDYGSLCYQYLVRSNAFHEKIVMFSQYDQAKEFLTDHTVVLLICDDMESFDTSLSERVQRIIYLTPNKEQENKETILYKYQSLDTIVSIIKHQMRKKQQVHEEEEPYHTIQTKLISIVPILSTMGGLELSYLFACEMQKKAPICYLNLSQFEDISFVTNQESQKSLSDLIYYMQQERDISGRIERTMCCGNGVSYIPCVEHAMDLGELGENEAKSLYDGICSLDKYQYIIVVIEKLTKAEHYFLSRSDSIFVFEESTKISHRKEMQVRRQLEQMLGEIAENMTEIVVPVTSFGSKIIGSEALQNKELRTFLRSVIEHEIEGFSMG